jgi:hypothetical protein
MKRVRRAVIGGSVIVHDIEDVTYHRVGTACPP